jgi:hypothetical protein
MHHCRKVKSKLIDLVFNETGPAEKLRLIGEVEGCDECLELYRSMMQTLTISDNAFEAGIREESYWRGYEAKLRARLASAPRASTVRRSLDWLRSFIAPIALPLYVKVTVALLILATGLWLTIFRQAKDTTMRSAEVQPILVPQEKAPEHQATVIRPVIASKERVRRKPSQPGKKAIGSFKSFSKPPRRGQSLMLLSADTANHIEKTELLLRAFRNIRPLDDRAGFDISYEKVMSRELLARNILLRRRAMHKENQIARELLANVEPILLDIANLPERASEGDVRGVKELMRKQEIISALQFYTAKF